MKGSFLVLVAFLASSGEVSVRLTAKAASAAQADRLIAPVADEVCSRLGDSVFGFGITSMSAGSHTEPGGYAGPSEAEPQFEISDTRSPADVAAMLCGRGYDPVWRDTLGARRRPQPRAMHL